MKSHTPVALIFMYFVLYLSVASGESHYHYYVIY